VDRAIDVVDLAIDLYGPPVYVRHEIVHNHFGRAAKARGPIRREPDDARGSTIVFSAHGVSPAVRAHAERRHLRPSTPPVLWSRVSWAVPSPDRATALYRRATGTEVEGTMGEVPERTILVQTVEDAERVRSPIRRASPIHADHAAIDETKEIWTFSGGGSPAFAVPAAGHLLRDHNRQNAVKAGRALRSRAGRVSADLLERIVSPWWRAPPRRSALHRLGARSAGVARASARSVPRRSIDAGSWCAKW
jgi:4-hydroxy-3-methylbut-2-enyl diphosphate reductase